jgi:hypothetical protein
MLAKPITKKRVMILLVMEPSVNKPQDYSQRISNAQTRFLRRKKQIATTSHLPNARNSGGLTTPKI